MSTGALGIRLATGARIAHVNGANDVPKGVAIVGAGLATEGGATMARTHWATRAGISLAVSQ